jgi:hypothetical protein
MFLSRGGSPVLASDVIMYAGLSSVELSCRSKAEHWDQRDIAQCRDPLLPGGFGPLQRKNQGIWQEVCDQDSRRTRRGSSSNFRSKLIAARPVNTSANAKGGVICLHQ